MHLLIPLPRDIQEHNYIKLDLTIHDQVQMWPTDVAIGAKYLDHTRLPFINMYRLLEQCFNVPRVGAIRAIKYRYANPRGSEVGHYDDN